MQNYLINTYSACVMWVLQCVQKTWYVIPAFLCPLAEISLVWMALGCALTENGVAVLTYRGILPWSRFVQTIARGQPPVVWNSLLEHSHAHLFICLDCFQAREWMLVRGAYVACKPKNYLLSGLLRKQLTVPVLKVHLNLSFSHQKLCYRFMDENLIPKLSQIVSSWKLGTISSLFQSSTQDCAWH